MEFLVIISNYKETEYEFRWWNKEGDLCGYCVATDFLDSAFIVRYAL